MLMVVHYMLIALECFNNAVASDSTHHRDIWFRTSGLSFGLYTLAIYSLAITLFMSKHDT